MNRSKQFKPVVEHAYHLEQEAAKALGEANQRVAAAEAQLAQLQRYRQEYLDGYQALGAQGGVEPGRLRDYQAFLAKLNAALTQQSEAIDSARRQREEVKQFWLAKRGRSKALDSVLKRYIEEEHYVESRKEQREMDDRSYGHTESLKTSNKS